MATRLAAGASSQSLVTSDWPRQWPLRSTRSWPGHPAGLGREPAVASPDRTWICRGDDLTGRHVEADEALRIGLVNSVHPAGGLLPEAREMAEHIGRNGPRAVRTAKRLMSLAFSGNPGSGLAAEAAGFAAAFGTAEQREGMGAFLEKRPRAFDDPV